MPFLRLPVRRLAALAVVAWLCGGVHARAEALKIVPLVRDGQVLVSCHLEDGYTSDVRDVIRSGLKTTFTYTVELRLKVPVWVDRVVGSAVVTTTVQFDNLTRRHSISRLLDGRVEDAKVTDDEAVVREWLTAFDKLPLFRTTRLEANREYLRGRARRGAAQQRRAVLALGHVGVGPDEVHVHSLTRGVRRGRRSSALSIRPSPAPPPVASRPARGTGPRRAGARARRHLVE